MTKAERAKAIALSQCRLRLCSWDIRFAQSMAWIAEHSPEIPLTQKQKFALNLMAWRYRRQLAGREDIELPTSAPDPDAYGVAPLEAEPDAADQRPRSHRAPARGQPRTSDPQRDLF